LNLDGNVWGVIPIRREQVVAIWNALNIGKENPRSAWHRIGELDEFRLDITSSSLSGRIGLAGMDFTSEIFRGAASWLRTLAPPWLE
jgi:hypothetical protein